MGPYGDRRWCTEHCGDALLYITLGLSRRCRPTSVQSKEIANCQHQGARVKPSQGAPCVLTPQQRGSTICELLFPNSILAVKMNRKTLVVVLETEIYIYDISNMKLLHVIETTPNPEG